MRIRIFTDRRGQGETGNAHLSNTRQLPSTTRSVIPRYSAANTKKPANCAKNHRFSCVHEQNADFAFALIRGGRTAIPKLFPQQFRSSSAAVPQQFRSSSAAVPQQLRSSSEAAPQQPWQQLRSSSAVVPCYLRRRSVLPPQSFRVTSAVAQTKRPHHHRHRLGTHTVGGCG